MEFAQGLTLLAATFLMGHMAGFFYTFSQDVMPGLGRSDDRTFVAGFQALDRAVINPWFLVGFTGAPLLTGVAALLQAGEEDKGVFAWTVAAFVLYFAVIAITRRVHLPLNAEIQAAGDPDQIADLAAVRRRFEARWVRWNIVRGVANTAAFGCLLWALVLFGRTQ
jgi:uncharacterized membrane protein